MDHKQRNKRIRLLVSKANKEQKKQAKKIDILCNDLIAAQRDFIKSLGRISFTANFYGSIVGTTELDTLLYTASKLIKSQICDVNVGFFLRQSESFELHMFEGDCDDAAVAQRFEDCFTSVLVADICQSNKICSLDCLLAMGLQGNPATLNKISTFTMPLGQAGLSLGFILVYRSSQNQLTTEQINQIYAITPGLSQAIQSCRVLSGSAG